MKRSVIFPSGVIAGIGLTAALYYGAMFILDSRNGNADSRMGWAFFAVLPVCLVVGSALTGFICWPFVLKRSSWIALCPGLWGSFLLGFGAGFNPDQKTTAGSIGYALTAACVAAIPAIPISLLGVAIGSYLRSRPSHRKES